MPRHATKRKQNKRGTKRTGKSFNKRRSVNKRQSVNKRRSRSVKYLGGEVVEKVVANLQPSILIKSGLQTVAECSVFSIGKKIFIVFQLNKDPMNKALAVAKGLGKGLINTGTALVSSAFSVMFMGDQSGMALQHKSVSYLLLEKLTQELAGFKGSIENEATLTGFSETKDYTAETVFFIYDTDKSNIIRMTENQEWEVSRGYARITDFEILPAYMTYSPKFDKNNPNDWVKKYAAGLYFEAEPFTYNFNIGEGAYDKQIATAVQNVKDTLKSQPVTTEMASESPKPASDAEAAAEKAAAAKEEAPLSASEAEAAKNAIEAIEEAPKPASEGEVAPTPEQSGNP
jgi:hypothetical protein